MKANRTPGNIKIIYLIRLFFWTHFISAVIVPFFTQWGGLKLTHIFLLNAWFMLWNFILEIPTGTVADFFGRKVSIASGCFVGIIAALVYSSCPSIFVFMIGEVLFAISFTLISGADEALVYDTLIDEKREKESKKIYSRMESFKLGGIVLGALVGAVIAKFIGLRWTMLLQSVTCTTALLFSLKLKEPLQRQQAEIEKKRYFKILSDGISYFFKNKILKLLALDLVFINSIAWLIIWLYQPLLQMAKVDIIYFGIIHSLMSISQIIIISNFALLEKILGSKRRLLFITALATGIFFILLGIQQYTPLVIVSIILAAGFGLSRGPLFVSYMNKHIPSDKRATVLSTSSMIRTFSIVIINPVAGFLADWSVLLTMVIMGTSVIVFAFLSRIKEEYLVD